MNDLTLRTELVAAAQAFDRYGLTVCTSGNLSARTDSGFLITPSGVDYHAMQADSLIEMDLQGEVLSGALPPSSEWRFHQAIYRSRCEVNAVIHVHSPYATAVACIRQDIPAFHYMIAKAGGDSIRCAEYATFGTRELSDNAVKALQNRQACLLANHGQLALGDSIASAFAMAREVEDLARQYVLARQVGTPILLDAEEIRINVEKFRHYGRQEK